jgi:hypothetical protein
MVHPLQPSANDPIDFSLVEPPSRPVHRPRRHAAVVRPLKLPDLQVAFRAKVRFPGALRRAMDMEGIAR